MGKRGPKPKELVKTKWSPDFAYAMGLLATDGCLSSNGLLIDLTSKDREQLKNFSKCLDVKFTIGSKCNGQGDTCLRIQFKNRLFYDFLLSIGFTPRKSLTLGKLDIPDEYFFDFLRGCFDGDGHSYGYWDPRWRSSFMFYTGLTSASSRFIHWLSKELKNRVGVTGHIVATKSKNPCYQIRFAKRESLEIIKRMYYNPHVTCLSRKRKKIEKFIKMDKSQQNCMH